jgi:ribosomal protein S18 acetylase RimI-like enzyme
MTTTVPLAPPAASPATGVAYHLYRGLEEIPGMAAANTRLRMAAGLLEPIDIASMEHRYTHLVNSDPLVDCVVVTRHGVTAGYTRVEWHDLTDGDRLYDITLVVEPQARGLGITDALVDWSEERLRQLHAEHPTDRRAWFGMFCFDGDEEYEERLQAHGYAAVRWDAEMLRDTLDDLPGVPALPDGYEIRPVPVDRLPDVAAMLVAAFREHWGEHEEQEDVVEEWVSHPGFDVDLVSVAWHGDAPAASVSSRIQPHADGGTIAYVDAVATHPDHRRLGLARACLADNLHRLAARGQTRAYLGVDTDNQNRAFALYEDAGFRRASGSAAYRKPFTPEPSP